MKKIIKEVKESFQERPLHTLWILILFPFAYLFLFLTSMIVAIIHFNVGAGVDFFKGAL